MRMENIILRDCLVWFNKRITSRLRRILPLSMMPQIKVRPLHLLDNRINIRPEQLTANKEVTLDRKLLAWIKRTLPTSKALSMKKLQEILCRAAVKLKDIAQTKSGTRKALHIGRKRIRTAMTNRYCKWFSWTRGHKDRPPREAVGRKYDRTAKDYAETYVDKTGTRERYESPQTTLNDHKLLPYNPY